MLFLRKGPSSLNRKLGGAHQRGIVVGKNALYLDFREIPRFPEVPAFTNEDIGWIHTFDYVVDGSFKRNHNAAAAKPFSQHCVYERRYEYLNRKRVARKGLYQMSR